jgi:GT2 family glycosyltransferase
MLQECLEALGRQTYEKVEIIVVDNGSTDGSVEQLRRIAPHVRLVELDQNIGFAGGNIEGLRVARGQYIALLNNDTLPEPCWLSELISAIQSKQEIGICASKLVFHSDPSIVDSAGDQCVTSGHGIKGGYRECASDHNEGRYVFGACAGAALYRRSMLDDIGFLDPDFFLNCEDTDLNFRAQLMGWKCVYVPTALVRHRVGASLEKIKDQAVYFLARNDEFVWIKNMPTPLILRYLHHKIVQELGVFIYFCVKRGHWASFFRGKWHALRAFPQLLEKRKLIQARKRVSNEYLQSVLTSIFERKVLKGKLIRLFSTSPK